MITVLVVLLSQVLGACHRSHARDCAKVYYHDNCEGESLNIRQGSSRFVGHHWNDHISSLVVKKGCKLSVYEHHNKKGAKTDFGGVRNSLRKSTTINWSKFKTSHWNDRISSLKCKCYSCRWYEKWNPYCS